MDQATAKKKVLAALAATLDTDLNGAGYIYDQETEEDADRMMRAAEGLKLEFERRAGEVNY